MRVPWPAFPEALERPKENVPLTAKTDMRDAGKNSTAILLVKMENGQTVESVIMPHRDKYESCAGCFF